MSDDFEDAPQLIAEGAEGKCPFCGIRFDSLGDHLAKKHREEWASYEKRVVWAKNGETPPMVFKEVDR